MHYTCAEHTPSILWFVKTVEKPFGVAAHPDEAYLLMVGTAWDNWAKIFKPFFQFFFKFVITSFKRNLRYEGRKNQHRIVILLLATFKEPESNSFGEVNTVPSSGAQTSPLGSVSECSASAFPGVAMLQLQRPRRYSWRELAFTAPVTLHKTPCHSSTARVAALALMETLTSSDRVFI